MAWSREAQASQKPTPGRPPTSAPSAERRPGQPVSSAQAVALQKALGNRAAVKTLARWAVHPEKDKKGVLLTDAAAAEYLRFNPPKNQ